MKLSDAIERFVDLKVEGLVEDSSFYSATEYYKELQDLKDLIDSYVEQVKE